MKQLLFLFFSLDIYCQSYLFTEHFNRNGKYDYYNALWIQQNTAKNTGVFGWVQEFKGKDFQAYSGPFFQVRGLQFGSGLGINNWSESSRLRFAHFTYFERNNFSNFFTLEHKGGRFVMNQTNFKINNKVGVGSLLYSPYGFGPRVEINFFGGKVKLYEVVSYKPNKGFSNIFGIRFVYAK